MFTCELKISTLKEEKLRRLKTTATAMCFLRPVAEYIRKTDGLYMQRTYYYRRNGNNR
jgi:hypothetical protein